MVGLVLVSHSRAIALGLAELVGQIAGEIPLAAVGGTADGGLGTDATAIVAAIERIWSPDGILILVDLGSSVLSTETALELIGPERAQSILMSRAPLVEGALAAGLEIRMGGSLSAVAAAAETAFSEPKF